MCRLETVFKLLSWVTLNAFLKFNVKVDAAFLFLNAVFKFLCIDYNKNCHPADVRCSSTVNKMNVQIRYSLSKNLRRAVAGLYKKFSILGVWCKVQTTVLFKNEWELGMMLSRSVFLKLFLSFFFFPDPSNHCIDLKLLSKIIYVISM